MNVYRVHSAMFPTPVYVEATSRLAVPRVLRSEYPAFDQAFLSSIDFVCPLHVRSND